MFLFQNTDLANQSNQGYGETLKPMDIDDNEEFERMALLKQREILLRGMSENYNNAMFYVMFISIKICFCFVCFFSNK